MMPCFVMKFLVLQRIRLEIEIESLSPLLDYLCAHSMICMLLMPMRVRWRIIGDRFPSLIVFRNCDHVSGKYLGIVFRRYFREMKFEVPIPLGCRIMENAMNSTFRRALSFGNILPFYILSS